MHPLENVIWKALSSRQEAFSEGFGSARRFQREVTLLSGFEHHNDEGYSDLAAVGGEGGTAAVFLDQPYEPRAGWEWVAGASLLQMVCSNGNGLAAGGNAKPEIAELGAKDSPEMIELTSLTKPGPFGARTHELGVYVGI